MKRKKSRMVLTKQKKVRTKRLIGGNYGKYLGAGEGAVSSLMVLGGRGMRMRSSYRGRRYGLGWIRDPKEATEYRELMKERIAPPMKPKMVSVWSEWRKRVGRDGARVRRGSVRRAVPAVSTSRPSFPVIAPAMSLGAGISDWIPPIDLVDIGGLAAGFVAPKMLLEQTFVPTVLKTGIPKYLSIAGVGLIGNAIGVAVGQRRIGWKFAEGAILSAIVEALRDNVPQLGLSSRGIGALGAYIARPETTQNNMSLGAYVSRPNTISAEPDDDDEEYE
jgi:hypothetical protein